MIDPTPEQIEAAAEAMYSGRYNATGAPRWGKAHAGTKEHYLDQARAALVAAAGVTPQEPGERAALLAEVDAAKVRPALHDIPDLLFRVRAALAAPPQVEMTELAQIAIAEIEKFEATAGPNRPLSHAGIWIARAVHERLRGGGQ